MQITIDNKEKLPEVAHGFIKELDDRKMWAIIGEMGAGKTTFVAEVCRQLEVEEEPGSPTFAICNEYYSHRLDDSLYHFDFYRIDNIEEALDFGLPDYLDSGRVCLMEWPERVEALLPEETAVLRITVNADGSRTFDF